jgi:hypothetical protein
VQGLLGDVTLFNPDSPTTLTVDDSADATARTVTLSTFSQILATYSQVSGLAPANINYSYANTTSVTVNTGTAAGNVVNVLTTGVTTNLVGGGPLAVNVGNAGSVQGILGAVSVENPPDFTTPTGNTQCH